MSKEVQDIEKAATHARATLEQPQPVRRVKARGLFEKETARVALRQAFVMLRPDLQWKNPVMFVVLVGAVLTLLYIIEALVERHREPGARFIFHSPRYMALFDGPFRQFCHRSCRGPRQGAGGIPQESPPRYDRFSAGLGGPRRGGVFNRFEAG